MGSTNKLITKYKRVELVTKGIITLIIIITTFFTIYYLLEAQSRIDQIKYSIFLSIQLGFDIVLIYTLKKEVILEFDHHFLGVIHRITGNVSTFSYKQFDGYLIKQSKHENEVIRDIIILKEAKSFQIVSSASVLNFEEVKRCIEGKLELLEPESDI